MLLKRRERELIKALSLSYEFFPFIYLHFLRLLIACLKFNFWIYIRISISTLVICISKDYWMIIAFFEYALPSPLSISKNDIKPRTLLFLATYKKSQFSSVQSLSHGWLLPVHHQLPELPKPMSTVSVRSSNHLILCCPLLLLPSIFPSIRVFSMSQLFTSGGQSIGVSASTSFLPMNTQEWSPLWWTGWISLQSKGLSRVFSNTQLKSINSSALSFLYSPTLTFIHDHWKNHSFDYMDLCWHYHM